MSARTLAEAVQALTEKTLIPSPTSEGAREVGQRFTVDSSPEFDQTHWIPQTQAPAEEPAVEIVRFLPRRPLHVYFADLSGERFQVSESAFDEPLAVTTSLEAAYAARRLLR